MVVNLIAGVWGFAEATLFFIVPDVWLSIAGRDHLHQGLRACLYGVVGALIGGSIIYFWGAHDCASAIAVMEKIPAVSSDMVSRVRQELTERGTWAIMLGIFSGTPYKLYTAQAANAGIEFWMFLLVSMPARLIRFGSVTILCHYVVRLSRWSGLTTNSMTVILLGWTLFYLIFFWMMPN